MGRKSRLKRDREVQDVRPGGADRRPTPEELEYLRARGMVEVAPGRWRGPVHWLGELLETG